MHVWIADPPYSNPAWSQFFLYLFLLLWLLMVLIEWVFIQRRLKRTATWDDHIKGLINQLQQYKRRCANPAVSDACRFDEAQEIYYWIVVADLFPLCEQKAPEYIRKRDRSTLHWTAICRKMGTQLTNAVARTGTGGALPVVCVMSSYGARMHLDTDSDVDFGILVDALTPDKAQGLGRALEEHMKFRFVRHQATVRNELFIYTKVVRGVTIEVKIRDAQHSKAVVQLHHILDTLPKSTVEAITYLKYTLKTMEKSNPLLEGIYTAFKLVVYNVYMSQIQGSSAFRV